MKIIVAQRHRENLLGIKEGVAKIDPARSREILFTSIPEAVLDAVMDGSPAFVVSGQVFDSHIEGSQLARLVKQVNPQVRFYMYSVMPHRNEAVDGVIPKSCGTAVSGEHPMLARILASDLEAATSETLMRTFQVG
ncbi:MAG: hypothetical protein CEO12_185 [Parcubacteria group bacterium Gr01-1014_46]|nr:MAG: hypothetical protein CEO12_185 [Parcubacteria group bacterium Gr01-1014_46]